MSLRTPLKRAKGLGSAKEGTDHWWAQRVSAIALVPLVLWLIVSLLKTLIGSGLSYDSAIVWIQSPTNTLFTIFFIIAAYYHGYLGIKVVIEDYIHNEFLKLTMIVIKQLGFAFLLGASIFAVLSVYFVG